MAEKRPHLTSPGLPEMMLAKMQDKSFNPIDIGLFGPDAVVFETHISSHLIQQPHAIRLHFFSGQIRMH